MTPSDEQAIARWGAALASPRTLTLWTTEDPRTRTLVEFCTDLERLAPRVRVVRDEEPADPLPCIDIGSGVRYRAVPEEGELMPFLDLLLDKPQKSPAATAGSAQLTDELPLPAHFELYIAPGCPFCPHAVARMAGWVKRSEMLKLTVVDGMLFEDLSKRRKVRSVPTLLLEDSFRWSAIPAWSELREVIASRDPSRLGAAALEDLLTEGRAAGLAKLMLEHGKIFPAYLELLTHERWPVRLAAMVAYEYICSENPALARDIIAPLCRRFDEWIPAVQGDVLHILGLTADSGVRPFLKAVTAGDYAPEVRSAALETLAEMEVSGPAS